MGLLYIVHRFNPDAIGRVRDEYQRKPDLDWAGAMQLFKQLGRRKPPDAGASSWEEYEELFEFERWNLVLTIAASEASWDLDKSLDRPGHGLPGIAALLPELAPVKALLSAMESLDAANLPKAFRPPETGLMGMARTDVVKAAVPAAVKHSRPDARAMIGSRSTPWLKRVLGGGATLSSWQTDDYLWSNWCRLLEAIKEAGSRDHCLALEVR